MDLEEVDEREAVWKLLFSLPATLLNALLY